MAGVKVGFAGVPGKTVPRAHQLTVVAAEDAVADTPSQVLGDAAVVLNSQVGNAAAGIQLVGRDDGVGGAHGDAGLALAAMVFTGLVYGQGDVGVDFTEEKPAAGLTVEHQGVFALPAQPGFGRQRLFHHRGAVHKGAGKFTVAHFRPDSGGQCGKPFADQFVVIPAQRIARDVGLVFFAQHFHRLRIGWQVIHARRDDSQGAGLQRFRAKTFVAVGAHPLHLPLIAFGQPGFQVRFSGGQIRIGNADLLEAQFAAPLLDVFL